MSSQEFLEKSTDQQPTPQEVTAPTQPPGNPTHPLCMSSSGPVPGNPIRTRDEEWGDVETYQNELDWVKEYLEVRDRKIQTSPYSIAEWLPLMNSRAVGVMSLREEWLDDRGSAAVDMKIIQDNEKEAPAEWSVELTFAVLLFQDLVEELLEQCGLDYVEEIWTTKLMDRLETLRKIKPPRRGHSKSLVEMLEKEKEKK